MTDIEQIESALQFIGSDDRDIWLQVGMATQSELGEAGFTLWDNWSQTADNYNSSDAQSVWKSFTSGGGVNIGTLFHLAGQNGWVWTGASPSQAEITQQRVKLEARNKLSVDHKAKKQQLAAKTSQKLWNAGNSTSSKYFEHKQVEQVKTVRTLPVGDVEKIIGYQPKTSHKKYSANPYLEGQITIVPILVNGKISTIEMIDESGRKSAIKDGAKSGGYWAAQKRPEADSTKHTFLIGEGIATVLSCRQATGFFAVAALSCHNLSSVAQQFKALYPESRIIIVSDRGNGEKPAREAAQAIGGLLATPEFPDEATGTDFNDLAAAAGREEVKRQIQAVVEPKTLAEITPRETLQQVIERLAKLPPLEYDQIRDAEAKNLNVRLGTLDREVSILRKAAENNSDKSMFPDDELYPEPVNGGQLLSELAAVFTRHSILPRGSDVALALWTVLTYCFDSFRTLPILAIISPEKRCGKTTTLETLDKLCFRSLPASNISPAAMFRSIEIFTPCLLVDEADTFIKSNDDLRGIINSGHTKAAAYVIRCDGDNNEPKRFSTWCPKVIAMIGTLPGTILDRAAVVPLRRKLEGETIKPHNEDNDVAFQELRSKIIRFVSDNQHNLKAVRPERLKTSNDRNADNWKPLLSIALVAGEAWETKARSAAQSLVNSDLEDEPPSTQLLADIRDILKNLSCEKISSSDLVRDLVELDDRPWCEWKRGKSMTKISLARLLKPFRIKSKKIRILDSTLRGYERNDFIDAFSRYLPIQSGTMEQVNNINGLSLFQSGTRQDDVPLQKQSNYLESQVCSIVPLCEGVAEGEGISEGVVHLSEEDLLDDNGRLFNDAC